MVHSHLLFRMFSPTHFNVRDPATQPGAATFKNICNFQLNTINTSKISDIRIFLKYRKIVPINPGHSHFLKTIKLKLKPTKLQ